MTEANSARDRDVSSRLPLGSVVRRSERLGLAMWSAIAASVALLVALFATGLGARAVELVAGLLVVVCIAICLLSAHTSHRTSKTIDQLTRGIAAQRVAPVIRELDRGGPG